MKKAYTSVFVAAVAGGFLTYFLHLPGANIFLAPVAAFATITFSLHAILEGIENLKKTA